MTLSENISKLKVPEKKEAESSESVDFINYEQFAVRMRLVPTKEQAEMFEKTFGCCRKVWNLMLGEKQKAFEEGKKISVPTPASYKKKPEFFYLKEVDSLALANVQINLNNAYKRFFDGVGGAPRFKSKHNFVQSYTTNNQTIADRSASVEILYGRYIKLPKIGLVEVKIHRKIDGRWELRSETISRASDGRYYVSVLFRIVKQGVEKKEIDKSKIIGLDYKSNGLYMGSDGNCADMPKFFQKAQKRLAIAQRRLSKKKGSLKNEKKSKNYIKQLKKVNRIHTHISNQRKDFLHKKSTEIANQYDAVCVEDLDMKAIANKGFGNGKATMNNGYGMFLTMLDYKLARQCKKLVRVDKWFPSSQLCSCCGHKQKMPLNVRVYDCPECGNHMDRDINAAINIRNKGMEQLVSA